MGKLLSRIVGAVVIALALMNAVMCSHSDDSAKSRNDSTKALRSSMIKPLHEGKMEEVISRGRPYYDSVRGKDDKARLLMALYLAEAYAMREDADSVKYFMDDAAPLLKRVGDSFAEILYYNIKGAWSLKHDLDYQGSLAAYYEGYRTAREAVMCEA